MDERLQEMLDHFEIRKTLSEYCQGSDRCDEDQVRSVYVEDSWDEHGQIKAAGPEFARLMTARVATTTTTMFHLLGQSIIHVDGDEAGAETYFIAASRSTDEKGTTATNQLGGRFVDKLVREDGRWRIKRRVAVRDWTTSTPGDHEWVSALALTPGDRSNDDPAYAVLSRVHGGRSAPA